ncbi:2-oxo-4-hydroxy-4-carboxy-5-ureidoimidazoline decarboxylase-like [Leguminivora glycinivorella]|uniref:2-oxo-4-hydroxy-4-carboxy-5-ureidoimidazoline decarboxylase-like n=1 Tax=Leguminivora glycinivorella TaxID=1035111 RepID=UPI00200CF09A|nr:2-oxo-4-hydroxy-4-carboxy-5-ureidoimidazoline decarboxylase-like [Leguminivora glycinivorella]
MSLITVSEVNNLSEEQFEWMFGNVIELCTEAAGRVKTKRPFASVDELCEAFAKYLDEISENEKLVVLKLHPDLAGRLAARGELTPSRPLSSARRGLTASRRSRSRSLQKRQVCFTYTCSVHLKLHPDVACRLAARGELTPELTAEQRAAGVDRLSAEQVSLIGYRNEKYKAKFGFPFIICARENKVDSIIDGLQKRYTNTRAQEILTGIEEVKKICKLRILDIVKQELI